MSTPTCRCQWRDYFEPNNLLGATFPQIFGGLPVVVPSVVGFQTMEYIPGDTWLLHCSIVNKLSHLSLSSSFSLCFPVSVITLHTEP
jgi:hypothetical protein